MTRRWDDVGIGKMMRIIKELWPVIVSVIVVSAGYGSIITRLNSDIDQGRQRQAVIDKSCERITRLEEAVSDIPEIRRDIKEILRRMK